MKVALIGDVHANLPALEAVLADAEARGAQAVWNIGDFVGYGPFPNEVVKRLQQPGVVSIIGNYDLKVLKFPKKKANWKKSKRREKHLAFGWAYESLSKKSRKFLRALPEEQRIECEGRRILLVHGSPTSVEEHLEPDTPEERLRELAATAEADVVVCGHSHRAFARKIAGVWFINTGSVGRPDDGDPRACYATLHLTPKRVRVQHHRIDYDVERAVAAVRERDLPEAFAEMLRQGRCLDDVLPQDSP